MEETASGERLAYLIVDKAPTFPMQTTPGHKPGEGAVGDCYRTCIAGLLGEDDPKVVPNFAAWSMVIENKGGWHMMRAARLWLREYTDFDLIQCDRGFLVEQGQPYILTVRSKAGPWNHCVLARGEEVIHDPAGQPEGYTWADRVEDADGDALCTPYDDPDPDEMLRRWARHSIEEDMALFDASVNGGSHPPSLPLRGGQNATEEG